MILKSIYDIGGKICILENFTVLLQKEQLEILTWRNNEKIRLMMNDTKLISETQHLSFINNLIDNNKKCFYKVSLDKSDSIGVVYLDKIQNEHAWLGIYSNPYSRVQQKGRLLMEVLFHLSFIDLKLKALFLEVRIENEKAIKLYLKYDFKTIKTEKDYYIMKKEYKNDNQ